MILINALGIYDESFFRENGPTMWPKGGVYDKLSKFVPLTGEDDQASEVWEGTLSKGLHPLVTFYVDHMVKKEGVPDSKGDILGFDPMGWMLYRLARHPKSGGAMLLASTSVQVTKLPMRVMRYSDQVIVRKVEGPYTDWLTRSVDSANLYLELERKGVRLLPEDQKRVNMSQEGLA